MHACVYLSVAQCVSIVGRWGARDTKKPSADAIVRGWRIISREQNVPISGKRCVHANIYLNLFFSIRELYCCTGTRDYGKIHHCVCWKTSTRLQRRVYRKIKYCFHELAMFYCFQFFRILKVIRQISFGLEAIHKVNIVHRDIKPMQT